MCKDDVPLYYKYWGKARKIASPTSTTGSVQRLPLSTRGEGDGEGNGTGYDYHLLVYHCLDVAAVGMFDKGKD